MKVDEVLMVLIGILSLIIIYKIMNGSLIEGAEGPPTLCDPDARPPQLCPGGLECINCGKDACPCPSPSPPSPDDCNKCDVHKYLIFTNMDTNDVNKFTITNTSRQAIYAEMGKTKISIHRGESEKIVWYDLDNKGTEFKLHYKNIHLTPGGDKFCFESAKYNDAWFDFSITCSDRSF